MDYVKTDDIRIIREAADRIGELAKGMREMIGGRRGDAFRQANALTTQLDAARLQLLGFVHEHAADAAEV